MLKIILINIALVVTTVYIHYEVLSRLSLALPKLQVLHRSRVALGMLGAICGHVIEIWIYAAAYYFMIQADGYGVLIEALTGDTKQTLLDCAYFSFTTYSSLGYGDIAPVGNIRFVAGLEALIGLVMITWSASFIYLEMSKFWDRG